jgi:hypothetical protein
MLLLNFELTTRSPTGLNRREGFHDGHTYVLTQINRANRLLLNGPAGIERRCELTGINASSVPREFKVCTVTDGSILPIVGNER